ncbi:MAG: SoxR reducing system RseC family protein [Candidatus Margulisiibacteriota bacterium]
MPTCEKCERCCDAVVGTVSLKAAFIVCIVPVIGMVVGGVFGWWVGGEAGAIVGALLFLLLSFVFIKWYDGRKKGPVARIVHI